MKMKKLLLFTSLLLIFILIIGGCSSKSINSEIGMDNAATEERGTGGSAPSDYYGGEAEYNDKSKYTSMEPEKIITTVYISMETKEFNETSDDLFEIIKKYNSYVENSNISHNNYINSSRLKYADYAIRIPKENLDNFIRDLKEIGNIISENTSKEDITKSYRDTESRLRLLETKEVRILALLEKADKMEDIIALENQLSDIIYQKESLSANLLSMDDKVDYSTLHFELREVGKYTDGATVKTPFSTKIKNAVNDSIYFFTRNLEGFVLGLIYFIPYGIILAILVFILRKLKKFLKIKYPFKKDKDQN